MPDQLVPYLEAEDPDLDDNEWYVVGFRNRRGETVGSAIPIARDTLERLVLPDRVRRTDRVGRDREAISRGDKR
jgi:hypothetical protein